MIGEPPIGLLQRGAHGRCVLEIREVEPALPAPVRPDRRLAFADRRSRRSRSQRAVKRREKRSRPPIDSSSRRHAQRSPALAGRGEPAVHEADAERRQSGERFGAPACDRGSAISRPLRQTGRPRPRRPSSRCACAAWPAAAVRACSARARPNAVISSALVTMPTMRKRQFEPVDAGHQRLHAAEQQTRRGNQVLQLLTRSAHAPRRRECSGTIRSSPAASSPCPALMSAFEQRRVEKASERRDLAKDGEQRLVERRARSRASPETRRRR